MIALRQSDQFTQAVGIDLNSLLSRHGQTFSRQGIASRINLKDSNQLQPVKPKLLESNDKNRHVFESFAVELSYVSMHFVDTARASLLSEISALLSENNWDTSDVLPTRGAFRTMLRALHSMDVRRPPSLGSNGAGSITASWFVGVDRLTLDFFDWDKVVFVLTRVALDGKTERAAGETRAPLLALKLTPYRPEIWFF